MGIGLMLVIVMEVLFVTGLLCAVLAYRRRFREGCRMEENRRAMRPERIVKDFYGEGG